MPPPNSADLSQADLAILDNIAENIVAKQCVLFLGAGVNMCSEEFEAEYPKTQRPPTGTELTKILKGLLSNEERDQLGENAGLSRVAQLYEYVKGGRLAIARELAKHTQTGKVPSPRLMDLAAMPFEYIVTTNYDQLLESALRATKAGKDPHVGVYEPSQQGGNFNLKVSEISEKRPLVYKIHGDIKVPKSIVITDEDYIHFIQRMRGVGNLNPVPEALQTALADKSILFIGYRLMDYNLRLLFRTLRWSGDPLTQPENYSIDPFPDFVTRLISASYQTKFVIYDLWKIIPILNGLVLKKMGSNAVAQ